MSRRVLCVIPAYDAEATVAGVIDGLRRSLPESVVLVIDDGSRDATAAVAAAAGASVTRIPANRGKGAALRVGFATALEQGFDAVLTVDADAQHDPRFAPTLVAGLDTADLVVGVRAQKGTRMPVQRRLTNSWSSAAVSFCAGCYIADAQSGYRAIGSHVLEIVRPLGDRYEFESDLLILAGRHGFTIAGVPVPTIYGGPSHFRPIADTGRVVGRIWQRLSHRAS